jgi:subtilisin family serine protease
MNGGIPLLKSIVSLIMSIIMSVTSVSSFSAGNIIDGISETLFGIPFSSSAMNDDFIDDISDDDIRTIGDNLGLVKNKVLLIMNPEINIIKKYTFFVSNGLKALGWITPADIYVVSCSADTTADVVALCEKLENSDEILLAYPLTVTEVSATSTPNDPYDFSEDLSKPDWNEVNPNGSNWWAEAIEARGAWDYSDYFGTVKIGVVDTGFDTDGEELKGKISFPTKRQASRNVPNDHGTHVAGIIAANMNNGKGIAGICPTANLVCVDWEPEDNQHWFTNFAIIYGFVAAVKSGAKAVNLSVGMTASIAEGENSISNFAYKSSSAISSYAMAALLKRGYDFVVVQSAGNGNSAYQAIDARMSGFFAAIDKDTCFTGLYNISYNDIINRVILVGAAKNLGKTNYMQASFSNSGPEVSITAPGYHIYSCINNNECGYISGTSMATPMVSAVAGLLWAVNPNFTGAEVKEIICSSTNKVALASDSADYLGNYELRDIPLLNAKLSVEEALKRTKKNMGTVTGTVDIKDTENTTVNFNGKSYTIYTDGSFSFVAEEGSGVLSIKDENNNIIYEKEIIITKGETVNLEFAADDTAYKLDENI